MTEKYKPFQDDSDLGNKNIQLNPEPNASSAQVSSEKKGRPAFLSKMIAKKEDVAAGIFVRNNSNATEEISQGVMNKVNTQLQFIGQYFNVEVDDIKQKLISSLIPFNKNFHELAEKNPDLYGPFWIYTTLIFLVSLAGNLSNYVHSQDTSAFRYNFEFIPNAAIFVRINFNYFLDLWCRIWITFNYFSSSEIYVQS